MTLQENAAYVTSSTSSVTDSITLGSSSIAGAYSVERPQQARARQGAVQKQIVAAVYAHIKAVRSLGRTGINTADIARALGLPLHEVERAVAALQTKGVRRVA